MIDGLKVICKGLDPQQWRDVPTLEFSRPVSERTGELGKVSEAKHCGLTFTITNAVDGGGLCSFTGSIHKHRNGGEDNADLFTYEDVAIEVEQLAKLYGIDPTAADLQRLEAGVNIQLDFKPVKLLEQAKSHRRRPFSSISRKDRKAGKEAVRAAYTVKLYDKSHGQPTAGGKYVFRMEVKFNRMRDVQRKCGIYTLADLRDVAKLDALAILMLDMLADIIYFDHKARPAGLTVRQQLQWANFGNADYWGSIDRKEYYRAKAAFATLRRKGGVSDVGEWVLNRAKTVVNEMRQKKQKKEDVCHGRLCENKADKKGTFATLDCLLPNVPFEGNEKGDVSDRKTVAKNADTKRRFCKTCGREITEQDPRSIFCAERLYGKEAKKCRNADSNHRAAKRRIIERAMQRNKIIWVTYEVNGEKYTDELTPQELYLQREWVDRVCTVRIIDRPAVQGKEAQMLLWKLQEDAGGGSSTPPATLTQPHGRPPQMSCPPSNNSRIATKEQPKCN